MRYNTNRENGDIKLAVIIKRVFFIYNIVYNVYRLVYILLTVVSRSDSCYILFSNDRLFYSKFS